MSGEAIHILPVGVPGADVMQRGHYTFVKFVGKPKAMYLYHAVDVMIMLKLGEYYLMRKHGNHV